jgi:hypothetical protein
MIIPILMSDPDVLPTFKDGRTGKISKNIIIIIRVNDIYFVHLQNLQMVNGIFIIPFRRI